MRVLYQLGELVVDGVEFARVEFGIVRLVDAFIAERGSDLEDTRHAADYETLEIQFWCDAESEFPVEMRGTGFERFRRRTASGSGEDRGADFDER